jgi:hypothetical protein
MSKYKSGYFLQFPRDAFKLLFGAKLTTKWLYTVLLELEHRYTSNNEDFFYHSIPDIMRDSELGRNSVIDGLKDLEERGLLKKWQMHWKDTKTGKKSERHITAIRLIDL